MGPPASLVPVLQGPALTLTDVFRMTPALGRRYLVSMTDVTPDHALVLISRRTAVTGDPFRRYSSSYDKHACTACPEMLPYDQPDACA